MPRALVVEDEGDFAKEAAEELELNGFDVDVALTYSAAIRRLGSDRYDVVSLDVMMRIERDEDIDREEAGRGRRTGLVIYKALRKRWPDTKVVICSVLASDPDQGLSTVTSVVEPGTQVLAKPVGMGEYVDAIREAAGV